MKAIPCLLAASAALFSASSAFAVMPIVKIECTLEVNENAPESKIDDWRTPHVAISETGCNLVTNLGAALRIGFYDPANPGTKVNVQNLKFTTAHFDGYRNGGPGPISSMNNVPLGAYNSVEGNAAKPDMYVRNAAGADVSPYGSQVIGTTVPIASEFVVADWRIPLGTASRPLMTEAGNNYIFVRRFAIEFTYDGEQHVYVVPDGPAHVSITVYPDLDKEEEEGSGPFLIGLQVSHDLANWHFVPNVSVPYPLPKDVAEIISFLPQNKTLEGVDLGNGKKRFYRFNSTALTPPPPST